MRRTVSVKYVIILIAISILLFGALSLINQTSKAEENYIPRVNLISPENNTIIKTTSPNFTWEGYDEDDDTLNYTLIINSYVGGISGHYLETTNTSFIVEDLYDERMYIWKVYVDDGKENSTTESEEWNFSINISSEDFQIPSINNITISNAFEGEDIDFNVNVTDNIKVKYVRIYYRNEGDTTYKKLEMEKTFENNYSASIPTSNITAKKLEYYIWAFDGINNCTMFLESTENKPFNLDLKTVAVDKPDLKISVRDIKFSNEYSKIGIDITINVTIHNIGNISVNEFDVTLHLDGEYLENKTIINLSQGQKIELIFDWTTTEGEHNFTVKIDEKNVVKEKNESNNNASKLFVVNSPSEPKNSTNRPFLIQFLFYDLLIIPIAFIVFLVFGIIVFKKSKKKSEKVTLGNENNKKEEWLEPIKNKEEKNSPQAVQEVIQKKKCPNCGGIIEITSNIRPLFVNCSDCKKEYKLKS